MPVRRGKCINFGNCDKADSRAVIEVPEGGEFACPEPSCGKALQPFEPENGRPGWLKLAVAALAGVLTVGGLAYFFVRGDAGSEKEGKHDDRPGRDVVTVAETACDINAMEEAHRKGDCAVVVKIGEGCAARMPNDATILNNLATGLLKCGETRRASELLAKAVELKPNDPYLRYNQACVEARSGNKDGAVGHLRKACQLGLAPATFRQDPDLASLIGFRPFEELMNKKCQ